jgi:nitroreductase
MTAAGGGTYTSITSWREAFAVAATPRYRASQRRRIHDASLHAMILVVAAAGLDCVWLSIFHPAAIASILIANLLVASLALVSYASLVGPAARHPEVAVLSTLVVVDGATIALGWADPGLGLVAIGYLLLLPARADAMLFEAKGAGRNCARPAEPPGAADRRGDVARRQSAADRAGAR